MGRHHAHAGNGLVMAVAGLVVIVCAAGVVAVMDRLLGGAA